MNKPLTKGLHFGRNLRAIRRKKGLTQAQLARNAGISRRMIGHYETQVKRPSIDKVKKIAQALNISDNELLGIVPAKKNRNDYDLSFKLMKKLHIVEKLPVRDQKVVFSLINSLAEKNKVRGKL
jgi:transcriptional regulator with XRE-family HTH domain